MTAKTEQPLLRTQGIAINMNPLKEEMHREHP